MTGADEYNRSWTALVVDDQMMVCKVAVHHFSALGARQVMTASNGRAALEIVKSVNSPDIILCDLKMPEMDGVEFLRHLGELKFDGGIALMSAEDESVLSTVRWLAETYNLRVLGAVSKPLYREFMAELVSKYLKPNDGEVPSTDILLVGPNMVIDSIKAGRIVNHYQPKIDLSSNEVLGVEALTRLSSPDGELMAPEFFIPVAERHQLINELTRSVIEQAVCDLCTLDDIAPEYSLAINFSINSLSRIEMADFLMSVLDEHSFDCRRLIAEVTESQAIQEGQTPLANLTRLRLHGVTLSVDDFGTGYATLAQLEQIPFQEIKLDKYFVSKVCNDRTSRAIVESTIAMARSLSMRVVAEGIHNAATQDAVTKLGVDHGQGFHISPPLPFDGLADFISDYGQPESTL